MLKELIERLKSLAPCRPLFDPSQFNDPLAMKTGWNPASGGGANFCTHKIVPVGPQRLEFRATVGAWMFGLVFAVIGLGIAVVVPVAQLCSGKLGLRAETLVPLLFGTVFGGVGVILLRVMTKPVVFDKRQGCFWKGRTEPGTVFDTRNLKGVVELKQVHAVQLVSEHCSGNKSSYYSYELNLVLHDGSRVNVVDHGSQEKIREQAKAVSEFLGVPVWDGM